MMLVFLKKLAAPRSIVSPRIASHFVGYCSISDETTDQWVSTGNRDTIVTNHLRDAYFSPLLRQDQHQLNSREIKVVDSDTWRFSSGLAQVAKGIEYKSQLRPFGIDGGDGIVEQTEDDPDLDDIEDMRIHGKLFYKIDPHSREFEEYDIDRHGRKSSSNKNNKRDNKSKNNPSSDSSPKGQNFLKGKEGHQETKKNKSLNCYAFVNEERLTRTIKEKYTVCTPDDNGSSCVGKKQRTPTFNQLTGPYHEPFCLDIHVSKGSVRACIVHRATSNVVAVAHSISKDMKFDVGSTKSATAAAAVGKVLAQRALADDIHNVIFTPRKGDRLEGKLHIVLQSIIDNGVNVKVKLKQRNPGRAVNSLQCR